MNDLKGIIEDCNKSDLVSDKVIKKIIEIIGQEKWQELHDENNDVCTTMGELIITLKGIAELEQENKVLAQNLEDTEIVNKALEKENAELQHKIDTLQGFLDHDVEFDNLQKENTELKAEVGSSIDCAKAQKNGELCLGYGGDEDEPCEQCKNCIKCECGYYQLGETEKDEQLTKAKEIIKNLMVYVPVDLKEYEEAKRFISEVEK